MSTNFVGLLVVLFLVLVSVNVIVAARNDPLLLAWLNQIIIGTILIALISYSIIRIGTRKITKKEGTK